MTETDAQQFDRRYKNITEAVDKFRDAILIPGPSPEEHRQAMAQINGVAPEFFLDACFALANYSNNQAEQVDQATVDAFVALLDSNENVRDAAFDAGAGVLGGALNDLGIALTLAGEIQWKDKTPNE